MSIDGVGDASPRIERSDTGFNGAVDEHRRSRLGTGVLARGDAPASMGPSMSIDGVTSGVTIRNFGSSCFNGAVDEHRRSPPAERDERRRRSEASMGPSMSIDGVLREPDALAATRAVLQWGRR